MHSSKEYRSIVHTCIYIPPSPSVTLAASLPSVTVATSCPSVYKVWHANCVKDREARRQAGRQAGRWTDRQMKKHCVLCISTIAFHVVQSIRFVCQTERQTDRLLVLITHITAWTTGISSHMRCITRSTNFLEPWQQNVASTMHVRLFLPPPCFNI